MHDLERRVQVIWKVGWCVHPFHDLTTLFLTLVLAITRYCVGPLLLSGNITFGDPKVLPKTQHGEKNPIDSAIFQSDILRSSGLNIARRVFHIVMSEVHHPGIYHITIWTAKKATCCWKNVHVSWVSVIWWPIYDKREDMLPQPSKQL